MQKTVSSPRVALVCVYMSLIESVTLREECKGRFSFSSLFPQYFITAIFTGVRTVTSSLSSGTLFQSISTYIASKLNNLLRRQSVKVWSELEVLAYIYKETVAQKIIKHCGRDTLIYRVERL